MLLINYPEPQFRLKKKQGKDFIFDALRKKWLLLTPEEWVRQNFIQYLIQVKGYPDAMIAQEKAINVGELKKRFDILVFDNLHKPWMMVECKAPSVSLNEKVLHQLLRYNLAVAPVLLVITNGEYSYAWEKKGKELEPLDELPGWK